MNEHVPVYGMKRIVLMALALAFLGMTLVSLWQRIIRPDLVIPSHRQMSAGQGAEHTGDMNEIGQLMQHLQQNPNDVAAMVHLAEHLVEHENWTAAENFLRRAVVAAPGDSQPLYLLGVVLHQQGNHEEAAVCLERVIDLRDGPSVRYSIGVLYVHYLQDPARGGQHLRTALTQPGLSDELARRIQLELDALPPADVPPKDAGASVKTAP